MNEKLPFEVRRKLFHMFMGVMMALLLSLDRTLGITAILVLFFWGVPNFIYAKKRRIPITLKRIMEILEREDKRGEGSLIYVLGCLLTALFFPNQYAIPGILVLAISDALATLVGTCFGKRKGKTLEGSLAFFISATIIIAFFGTLARAVIAAFFVALIEFIVREDNFFVPISTAFLLYILPV
jgi:dolichol kinase